MSGSDQIVWWRGSRFDARTVDMLLAAEALSGCDLTPSQGSYNGGGVGASAGTHDGGGAWDGGLRFDSSHYARAVWALRVVGFAAWDRLSWQGPWPRHLHAIAVQPGGVSDRGVLSASAHGQVVDYANGRDGLAGGGPDTGPRSAPIVVGRTFEEWQASQASPAVNSDDEEDGSMFVIRQPSGSAFLVMGGTRKHGIHSAGDLAAFESAGIPVVDVGKATFDAVLAGRS